MFSNALDEAVGIATRYGRDVSGIKSRWGRDFFAPSQTGPEAHPVRCTKSAEPLSGDKAPERGVNHFNLAPKLKKDKSCTSTTPLGLHDLFCGGIYIYPFCKEQ